MCLIICLVGGSKIFLDFSTKGGVRKSVRVKYGMSLPNGIIMRIRDMPNDLKK